MKGKTLSRLSIVVAATCFMVGASAQELKESPPTLGIIENSAKLGEIFTGVVYQESGNELLLDRTPCSRPAEKKIKPFVQPYIKTKTGEKYECGKDTFQQVRVEKK